MDYQASREHDDDEVELVEDDDCKATAQGGRFDTICVNDFAKLELPPRTMVLDPILPTGGLGMVFAGRGIGKTHVALGIAWAVSTGGKFLRWHAPVPRDVLYVDGEMPQQALQDRLKGIRATDNFRPDDGAFRLLCMDRQELGMSINLADPKQQKIIDMQLENTSFMVLDNLSTLMNGGPENDAESWDAMQAWLLQLRRRGMTVLVVHHAGRNGNARGTSKREDVLDTIIQLKHPTDYNSTDGARFEVHLTKARGVFGDGAEAFVARMETDEQGAVTWVCSDLEGGDEEEREAVLKLSEAGKSVREIGKELNMSKSSVGRLLQKAKRLKEEQSKEA
jgi:putative DNA primase/helicase